MTAERREYLRKIATKRIRVQSDTDLLSIPMGVVQFYTNLWGNTSDPRTKNMVFFPTQVWVRGRMGVRLAMVCIRNGLGCGDVAVFALAVNPSPNPRLWRRGSARAGL